MMVLRERCSGTISDLSESLAFRPTNPSEHSETIYLLLLQLLTWKLLNEGTMRDWKKAPGTVISRRGDRSTSILKSCTILFYEALKYSAVSGRASYSIGAQAPGSLCKSVITLAWNPSVVIVLHGKIRRCCNRLFLCWLSKKN